MLRKRIIDDLCTKYATKNDSFALLHLFNPSQEIALADNTDCFTPKAMVRKMEAQLADFPKFYADDNDAILMPDNSIINLHGERVNKKAINHFIPFPWGWNKTIKKRLIKCGISEELMPSDNQLDYIRLFAGRKFCVEYIRDLFTLFDDEPYNSLLVGRNMRFFSKTDYLNININGPLIFKQLWSSSGRGNIVTDSIDEKLMITLNAFCRNQGGFICDFFYDKTLDFAMEFYVFADGSVEFVGYSVFNTENNGKYLGNWVKDQKDLEQMILNSLDESINLDDLKNAHIMMLKKYLVGNYTGFVGVDMMAVHINDKMACHPCVELNLRMNLGIVAMEVYRRSLRDGSGIGTGSGAFDDGAWRISSYRSPVGDIRERGFHTSLKSCLISIRYS